MQEEILADFIDSRMPDFHVSLLLAMKLSEQAAYHCYKMGIW